MAATTLPPCASSSRREGPNALEDAHLEQHVVLFDPGDPSIVVETDVTTSSHFLVRDLT
jgi:hypothetical protein